MDDGTTAERGNESGGSETHEQRRVEEALGEILSNEAKFRYLVVALVAAGLWWQALDPISAFTAGMGFVVLVFVIEPAIGMLTTTRWATTEGVVLESEVLTRGEAMKRADVGISASRSVAGYVPLIRYEYTIDGTTYENARISPVDASTSRRRWAEALIDHYPDNKWVNIRYHPGDPTRSYLQSWTRASRVNVFVPIALFFLTLAITIAIGVNTAAQAPAGLVPIVMGLPLALWGLYGVQRGLRSYSWPTTTGVVTGSNVKAVSGGEDSSARYRMEVLYEYDIDGETYVSKRYSFGGKPSRKTRSVAKDWLENNYPIGSDVTVHYNPDKPDETVLRTGGAWNAFVVSLGGIVFCGLGAYLLVNPDPAIPPVVETWIDRLLEQL